MKLGMEAGLCPGHIRWGLRSAPQGAHPPFSTHVCCGETAEWIKMPLGMEVGLGPVDIVLDGDPAPKKGQIPAIFSPCQLWPNGRPSLQLLSTC